MSIVAPDGFIAGGLHCGIKDDGVLDLALVATARPQAVPAAAVFTTNKMTAAPVVVSRQHLAASGGRAGAVIVNSGNANAATGSQGRADAERMCALAADELGYQSTEVLVCSTGIIGVPLPMEAIEAGVPKLVAVLAGDGPAAASAAEAIRTTDGHRKETVVGWHGFTVGGMAKGSGMVAPRLATMLALLTTDAKAEPEGLRRALGSAVSETFNALLIDGATSTNDTVIVLASGAADVAPETELAEGLTAACADLAHQLADDAEGATKVVRVRVTGAVSDDEARRAARKVAGSVLVKCSWYGEDPYWGRIASELGSAGVRFDGDRVSLAYGGVVVARDGAAASHDEHAVREHFAGRHLEIDADLGLGDGQSSVLTNDLTHAYIDENMGTS
ncbi:MAG: bifunctional glutamate N-acetyltransferase/amino-acid acetyltransferase ArgJ [Acidimicrobiales bacterium]